MLKYWLTERGPSSTDQKNRVYEDDFTRNFLLSADPAPKSCKETGKEISLTKITNTIRKVAVSCGKPKKSKPRFRLPEDHPLVVDVKSLEQGRRQCRCRILKHS